MALLHLFLVHRIMRGREDHGVLQRADAALPRDRVDLADAFDLVAEKFDAQGVLPLVGGNDLQHVALARGSVPREKSISLRSY